MLPCRRAEEDGEISINEDDSRKRSKRFLLALIVMTGLMYVYYTTMGFMPTFLQKYLNIDTHQAATIMIAATLSSLAGTVFVGFISQLQRLPIQ